VVPKGESEASGKGGNRARAKGSKAKAKGAKGKRGRPKGGKRAADEPDVSTYVDPSYAVLVKYKVRGQIVALGHRRLISPSEVAREFDLDLPFVSRHFRVLRKAGFLELVKEEEIGGVIKHYYRSTKRALFTTVDWGKLGEAVQEEMAPGVVQDLNVAFREAMETGTFYRHDDVVLFWLSLMLDKVSWPEFVKILAWAIEEVKELAEDTVNRHANGETEGCFPAVFAAAGFELPTESERKKAQASKAKKAKARSKAPKRRAPKRGGKKGK
jgi:DNA-binding transcriptional ArsR family regulator